MIPDSGGLYVHRASRTERLADELAVNLEGALPSNPLQAQTIVVAHAGLKRWLLDRFARRTVGSHGIAANFRMLLPWQWLEDTARKVLGEAAPFGGAYRQEFLRWHIFRVLPKVDSAYVDAYLAGTEGERRRFALADRLAGVFIQYLIYRPEWIIAWERGDDSDWQAAVWRAVERQIGKPHRLHRREALVTTLSQAGDGESLPLHVFGVSHLAPDVLAALRALALRRSVHLYFPDPCREHWVYLRDHRSLLKLEGDPQALYFEIGHPLLAALGRMAQDFCLALEDADGIDQRDPLDDAPQTPSYTLLESVQSSIRCCEPQIVGARFRADVQDAPQRESHLLNLREDSSLRVHACHTRLRELEVLKDALLRFLADNPSLDYRDIVVMAPDIAAYAPYLPAVFGQTARFENDPAHIPWHLADVGLARAHPLIAAFTQLLELAESRFLASQVLDFLDLPAVARRFGIQSDARETLERWLRHARVAWGLDAQMKAQAGAAAIEANSWQFAFDRLYAGLLMGSDDDGQLLDGIYPVAGVAGNAVEVLGKLDQVLVQLRRMRIGLAQPRALAGWSDWLLDLIDAMFQADPRDDSERAALDTLRRLLGALAEQGRASVVDELVPWSVVREAVRGALDEVSQRQPFLLGGVTFCGLVPQRSIPFRVVCLIGMNEGEFPRAPGDAGLNRMHNKPRRGDRDTRSEDRYLFLEALMSARAHLHISFVGEGVRDGKPRNPAAPLAELLQFLDEQHGLTIDAKAGRPWLVRHPLQAFDSRYFRHDNDSGDDGAHRHDPRFFSYVDTFATTSAQSLERDFDDGGPLVAVGEPAGEVSLATLKRFWRDPARQVLRDSMGVGLEVLDAEVWPDREPMEAKADRRERIERRLLFEALDSDASHIPVAPPDWLGKSGALAAGIVGAQAYVRARDCADAVLRVTRTALGDSFERVAVPIDLDLGGGLHLTGEVERVYQSAEGQRILFDAKPGGAAGFAELLPFYFDWAALRLASGAGVRANFVEYVAKSTSSARTPELLAVILEQDETLLRSGLRRLIQAAQAAGTKGLLFPAKTAWDWAKAAAGKRHAAAYATWQGHEFGVAGERNYAPGYAGLLGRDLDFGDVSSGAYARFAAATQLVCEVLDPERRVLLRSASESARRKA